MASWEWLLAIVLLLALSAGIFSSLLSTYDNAVGSVDAANRQLDSSDIIVYQNPGADLSRQIEAVGGVRRAMAVMAAETYTLPGGRRVRGQVSAVPLANRVDNYRIIDGRDISGPGDIVVETHYAQHHHVSPGDKLTLYLDARPETFTVTGIYFSPANLYMISPEGWIEDDFGYFNVVQGTLGGMVNEYRITANGSKTISQTQANVQNFLSSRGVNAVVSTTGAMLSKTAFKEDAGSLNSLAGMFTAILLFVSAFIFFIVMSRNVERKRRQIGVYRAMGFSRWNVFAYFLSFSLVAVFFGVLLSIPVAYALLHYIIGYWVGNVLEVPGAFISYNLSYAYVLYSAVFSLVGIAVAAAVPAWRAASLSPAEAMKAYAPSARGSRFLSGSAAGAFKKLFIRDVFGHKVRSVATVIGVALVLSLSISFVLSMDSYVAGIKSRFTNNEKWNIRVLFTGPESSDGLKQLRAIPGVTAVEPYSGTNAEISANGRNVEIEYSTIPGNSKMTVFSLTEGNGSQGLVISGDVAYRLGVKAGDTVTLQTPAGKSRQKVGGIFKEFGSSEGYSLRDTAASTGAQLTVVPGQMDAVSAALAGNGSIQSWATIGSFRDGWLTLFTEYQGMVAAMDLISVVLALVIIGIFAFLAATERRWEFVTLKLTGFSNVTIIRGAVVEYFTLAALGAVAGIPIGMALASSFNSTFESLMSPPPIVMAWQPVIERALLIIGVTIITTGAIIFLDLRHGVVNIIRRIFDAA